jgi:16S rRNA (guanine966-N2)-methyltransferase
VTRIVSGAFGGRQLDVPTGAATRPTSDRVREAVFGRLDHQDVLDDARVLDLYAGSGALGLEALSRGARAATFVECDRGALNALRRNVSALVGVGVGAPAGGHDPAVRVLGEPVERVLLRGSPEPYDLVLADPPYPMDEDELADVLALLPNHGWLGPDGLVVLERSARSPEPRWPAALVSVDERRYGETRVWWARVAGDPAVA